MEPDNSQYPTQTVSTVNGQQQTKPRFLMFIKNVNLAAVVVIIFVIFAIGLVAYFYNQSRELRNMLTAKPASPTPYIIQDKFAGWKTIVNPTDMYRFSVPKEWKELQPPKDTKQIIYQSVDGLYRVTTDTKANLNKSTGKPYASLDEIIGLPYTVKSITIDNHEARQPLPRAGSENLYTALVFSPDLKQIVSIELLVGDGTMDDHRVTAESIKIAGNIFEDIISNFKFISFASPTPVSTPLAEKPSTSSGTFCTMETKLCPDGSYVGRTGPNCEFAPCPATPSPIP